MFSTDDQLIDAIYEAASEPDRWVGVLALLTNSVSGTGAALHVGDTDCSGFAFGASFNVDPDALSTYAEHYFSINPLNPPLTRLPAGVVVGDDALVPRHEYARTEYQNEYGRRFDIEGSATAVLAKSDGQLACLGIVSGVGAEPYSASELAILGRLLPHLQRAVDLNRKLVAVKAERDSMWNALDALELGVVLLDRNSKGIVCNAAARALLVIGKGLRAHKGRIVAVDHPTNTILQGFIGNAVSARGNRGGTMAVPRQEERPLLVRVTPSLNQAEQGIRAPKAVLFIRDPVAALPRGITEIAGLYGLSKREAEVAAKLTEDKGAREAAEELGISEVTVRNHIAHALGKTGTKKQSELIRLLIASKLGLR